ncbi:MAG: ABC transporter ATP-binding protein [Actinomycetaceae bacterium]|nr:ABC transporter ATP-binding protein [Actinomycetaceae bacterium]
MNNKGVQGAARSADVTGEDFRCVGPNGADNVVVTDSVKAPSDSSCAAGDVYLQDVSFQYPNTDAPQLQDFTLHVPAGTCLALLGPSGCAKTTVLRLIAGLEVPNSGTITIGKRVVAGPGLFVQPQSREVGLVFQDYALFPHLSVEKNVAYGLFVLPRNQRAARVTEMLDLVELGEYARKYPHQLSGGQAQRVALARALAPRPKVLLLDEPFSHLDANLRSSVREEVSQVLAATGVTAILVTHDEQDATHLADNVVVMSAP